MRAGLRIQKELELEELITTRDILEESLARYAHLYDAAPVGFVTLDGRGTVRKANLTAARMLGLERSQVEGVPFSVLVERDHLVRFLDHLRRLRRGSHPVATELRLRGPAGADLDIEMLSVPLRDADRTAPLFGTALVDIRERRRAEDERNGLVAREREARALAEAAADRVRAIQSVTDAALSRLTLDDLLRELLVRIRAFLKTDCGAVLLLSRQGGALTVRACLGLGRRARRDLEVRSGQGIAGRVATRRQPLLFENVPRVKNVETALRRRVGSLMAVPMVFEDQVLGVLYVGTRRRRRFSKDDLHLLSLVADRVAPAIDRARLLEEARDGRQRLVVLSQRMVDLQEEERRSIARELHDEIGQQLTGLLCMLEVQERLLNNPPAGRRGIRESGKALRRMKTTVADLMKRVRGLCMGLNPPILPGHDLMSTLRWYVERFTAHTGLRVRIRCVGNGHRVLPDVQTACLRVIQESLTNIVRHAGVNRATVTVHIGARLLRLRVSDRGQGFDVGAAALRMTCGLTGMFERARGLGGRLDINSAPGSGTRIAASIPHHGAPSPGSTASAAPRRAVPVVRPHRRRLPGRRAPVKLPPPPMVR